MSEGLIAKASVTINAPTRKVWEWLINPEQIKQYMFDTTVESDWREGSSITWKGEWEGKSYEDKGTILQLEPGGVLQYSHFSPLSGLPDEPENYHTVTIRLSDEGGQTGVSLEQDKNPTEEARDHSQKNWESMLEALKKLLEKA
jgi:uncharacterized protein YndB with AHSA1/START domain